MASREQFTLPEQMWFDPANPDPLHEALRADHARTMAAVARRPSLVRHVRECPTCQAIGAQVAQAPHPIASRKRIKLVVNPAQMHRLLNLPAHFEIVHMFADNDPNTISVLVAGEGLPEAESDHETPVAPADVMRDAMNKTS